MGLLVALNTQGYQVLLCIISPPASQPNVVNLEVASSTTALAAPAVSLQYLSV